MRNRGLAPDEVERLSSRPVPRIRVAPVDDPNLNRADRVRGRFDNWRERSKGEVKIFRPERRRTEEAVRKFRKNQSDDARESGASAAAPRPARRVAKPVPPGLYPGGKPAVAAASPPRFERHPADAKPDEPRAREHRDAAKPVPAPIAAPSTPPPSAATRPAHKSAAPATVPTRAPAPANGTEPLPPANAKIINPSEPPPDARPPSGKRRWDGSGPSGAPSAGSEQPAEN